MLIPTTEQHDPLLPVPNIPLDVDNPHLPDIQDEPVLGTLDNYRTAYLQRLADPTLPFNSVTNPYRTVDWLTLDLTVYSGEEKRGDRYEQSRWSGSCELRETVTAT